MNLQKRPRPAVHCTRCFSVSSDPALIGQECIRGMRVDAPYRVCPGTYREVSTSDWIECRFCHATGGLDHQTCNTCVGRGWLYVPLSAQRWHTG